MERFERTRIGIITPDDAVNDDEYWEYVNEDVTLLIDRYPRHLNPNDPHHRKMVCFSFALSKQLVMISRNISLTCSTVKSSVS